MRPDLNRRQFVAQAAAGAAIAYTATSALAQAESANETITLGIMGVNGRGAALAQGFASQPNCEVAYICDVDERVIGKGVSAVEGKQTSKPQTVGDFRKMLDDKSLDAIVVAAPNHWHGPATILGCSAGKHVYVEKPCCHNPREGEQMLEIARKNKRIVTQGTQRRSWPAIIEGIEKVRGGQIGDVHYSRSWYNNRRGSIGKGTPAEVPTAFNWNLWQGPAPRMPFKSNFGHYNWHWFWQWGNGELGNNGVHALDLCRWGLGVDFPTRVTSSGGRYRWDDDQQTPDTHVVSFNFDGKKTITWEGLSCSPRGPEGDMFGASFHGDEGTLVINGSGYILYDQQNKEVSRKNGDGGDATHLANFLACIKSGQLPNADIEQAYKTTLLCHLGNMAHRTDRVLHCDPQNGHVQNDEAAMAFWSREYEPGWEPKLG